MCMSHDVCEREGSGEARTERERERGQQQIDRKGGPRWKSVYIIFIVVHSSYSVRNYLQKFKTLYSKSLKSSMR